MRTQQQFTIPIYQRTYSWQLKQCEKLWDDIIKITTTTNNNVEHFIGSIVKIKRNLDTSEISQLIFESLNSTGLGLSQADLIKNYVLMGLKPEHQKDLYHNYWRVMEKSFGQTDYTKFFDRFMRDYLTIKTGTVPNIKNVYETFKHYFYVQGGIKNVDEIIADIHKYSKYFVKMALDKEENRKLKEAFSDLNDLKVDVAYPFLLRIYNDFEKQTIDQKTFLDILNFIQSYIFRRFICGIPTNSLNKTFPTLYKSIDEKNYLDSLKATFVSMSDPSDYRYFPGNREFTKALKEKDLYNTKNRNFWLRRFENYNRKERMSVEEYTIEHIMPQDKNLSSEWKEMLGENWAVVHENYLHTIGNLTLTGYNSKLSNKPFLEKKRMEGGFDNSPLALNKSLQQVDIWNKESINQRAEELAETMLKIWPYPTISEETGTANQ